MPADSPEIWFSELAGRVVFVTGDSLDLRTKGFLDGIGNPRVEKPCDLASIRKTIREVLASAS